MKVSNPKTHGNQQAVFHEKARTATLVSKILVILCIGCPLFMTQAQNFDLVGWATQAGGTTGGAGGDEVTVSTGAALQDAIDDADGPRTIYINGTITLANSSGSKIDVKDVSDISIIGVGTRGELDGIGIKIWRSSNIIVRNLKIHHVLSGDKDCISIEGPSDHIWIDHNELYNEFQGVGKDFYDGLLDAKGNSEYLTYSWNYLHDSWKASLLGSSENDDFDRKITMHHNYYRNINSRLPLFRGGQGHIFNNVYEDIETGCINSRLNACVKIENNYFDNANDPWYSADSDQVGDIDESGNTITNGSSFDNDPTPPGNCNANIPYSYSNVLETAGNARTTVLANVGVGVIDGSDQGGGNGGCSPTAIIPFVKVNNGSFQQTTSVRVTAGSSVTFGPQPVRGGSWSWSGCGTAGSSREQLIVANSSCSATATFTNSEGCQSTQTFSITVTNGGGGTDGDETHNFTTAGLNSSFYTISGNLSTSKGTVTYEGLTLSQALKIESSTSISFTSSAQASLTLVFNDDFNGDIRIDGVSQSASSGILTTSLSAGSHTLTKDDVANLFYMSLDYANGTNPGSGNNASTIRIQENETGYCGVEGSVDANHAGFTASGFINTFNNTAQGADWSINGSSGEYIIRWRFANGSSVNRSGTLYINGNAVATVDFPSTGSWANWTTNSTTLSDVPSGTKTIRLEANQSGGLANLDYVEVTGPGASVSSCNTLSSTSFEQPTQPLKVYPFPATAGQFTIDFSSLADFTTGDQIRLSVYTLSGLLVQEKNYPSQEKLQVQLSLEKGMYLMVLDYGNKQVSKKIWLK